MITALDTNILLDLLIPNARFLESARIALDMAYVEGDLILCEAVYAELASQFDAGEELERFLRDTGIQRVPATSETLFRASRAWLEFNKRRPKTLVCPSCGHIELPRICSGCGQIISIRQHIISDFLIGAHAEIQADRLLTRDRGFYKTYFKDLKLFPLSV